MIVFQTNQLLSPFTSSMVTSDTVGLLIDFRPEKNSCISNMEQLGKPKNSLNNIIFFLLYWL